MGTSSENTDISELLSEILCKCRVCGKKENYTNLFFTLNKELLKNLSAMVQDEITYSDTLSSIICRECSEHVEAFVNFRNKYFENFEKTKLILEAYDESKSKFKQEETLIIESVVEKYDATIEDIEPADLDYQVLDFTKDVIEENCEEIIESEESALKTSFDCKVCNKTYRYLSSLGRHVRTVHRLERFSCIICSAEFTQKSSLIEHSKNIHSDEQTSLNLKCDFDSCEKSFNTLKCLNRHKKKSHSSVCLENNVDQKSFATIGKKKKKYRKMCTICGLFFKHIEEHKLTHQAISTFQCEFCDKTFKFNTSLNVHRRIHTNERNFECFICKKKFRVSHHLKEHLTTHSKEKTFVCEVRSCSKKFSSKLNLYKHSKLHLKKA